LIFGVKFGIQAMKFGLESWQKNKIKRMELAKVEQAGKKFAITYKDNLTEF